MYHVYRNQVAAAYSSLYFFVFLSLQFSTLKFFVTLFSGTWGLEDWNLVHTDSGQMYHVYQNQAAAAYSSPYFFFFLSNFQHWNFWSHFSRELWGLEDWNLVHIWTVGRCIRSTRIRLLLLIHPFISSFFFLSSFQHWNFSSHFSWELWGLEDWNLVHMDSGQMYHVYQNQASAAYSSLLFLHFSFQFSTLKFLSHFSRELWGLEDWKLVHLWTGGWYIMYTRFRLLLLIHPFISSFFFFSNFQTLKFLSHFSQELWGLEDWNLVHMWIVGRCIMYTGIRLLLICSFISSFSFSPIFKH